MPFHPEELHKHVKQLEQAYAEIPSADGNARIAVAKAIISATASFVEGCLDDLTRFTLAEVGVPHPIGEWVLEKRRGFQDKKEFLKEQLAVLRAGWQVNDCPESLFVEGRMKHNKPGLFQLRNKVAHGDVVDQADLRLHSIRRVQKIRLCIS
jgi:hypothetical protein